MRKFLVPFLTLVICLVSIARAATLEERVKLRHETPERIAARVNLLMGDDADFEVNADERTKTLVVRIPNWEKGEIEGERLRLAVLDMIRALDRPLPEIHVSIYAVQPALLSEAEFQELDTKLQEGPLELPKGSSAKGVIYWREFEAQDQEVLTLDGHQGKMSGQRISGPVTAEGRLLTSLQPGDRVVLVADLKLATEQGELMEGTKELAFKGRAADAGSKPLMIISGKGKPSAKSEGQRVPMVHEMILYMWARPVAPEEKKGE